jgi:aldehyde dehydrogenase
MSYVKPTFKAQYENFIGGEWVAPVDGNYFEAISPIDNQVMTKVAQSNKKDVQVATDAAWKGFETWGKTSVTQRSAVLNKIADAMEANLEMLAVAETWDNGKGIRETINADLPLAIDHFSLFCIGYSCGNRDNNRSRQ